MNFPFTSRADLYAELNRLIGVYAIVHNETGDAYVGASDDLNRRWYLHLWHLNHGTSKNPQLQEAYDHYGADAFSFVVLATYKDSDALLLNEAQVTTQFSKNHTLYNARIGTKYVPGYQRRKGLNRPKTRRVGIQQRSRWFDGQSLA